jgi:hypothetical protein
MKKKRKEAAQKNPADSFINTAETTVPERDPEVSSGNLLRQLVLPFYLLEVFAALVIAVILMLTGGSSTKLSFTGSADTLNSCSFRAEAQGIRSTRLINLDTDPTEIEITLPVREADTITLTVKAEKPAILRDFRIDGKELSGNESLSIGDEKITGGIIRADKGSSSVTISGLTIDKGRFTESTKSVLFLLFVITVITPQVLFIACKAIARRQLFFKLRRYVLLAFSLRSLKIYALVLIPAAALAPHILASSYTLSFDVTADRETTANFTAWYTLHDNDAFSSSKSATRRLDVGNDPVHVSLTLDAPYISRFRFEPGSTARLSMTDLKLDGVPLLTLCDDMVWTDMDRHTCTGTELQTYTTARHGRATIEGVKGLSDHLYELKLFLYGAFVLLTAGFLAYLACRRGTDGTAPDKRLMRDFILDSVLVTISFWIAVQAVFAFRVTTTYQRIADQPGGFMHMSVHQYPVYLIVMLLLLGVYLLRQKVLRLLLILVLAVFSGLVISDFVVMRELNARVIISEVLNFADGLADSSDIVIHFFRREFGILTLLFAVITVLAVITAVRRGNAAGKTGYKKFRYAVLLTGSALIAAMPLLWIIDSGNSSIFDGKFKSILEVSGAGAKRNYLKAFTRAPGPAPVLTMEKGLGAHHNIIFILTESLSSYQSRFFGGLTDGTPRLDRIAEESLAFTNYHSNGYNTAVATFTVLTGLPYINSARGYTDKGYLKSTVIRDFRREGYYTTMMYSSKSIAGIDTLYANAGFDELSTGADPFYRNSRRLTFDSVPDHDLFENALLRVKKRMKSGKPFFTLIMTATNHPPFLVPDADEYSSEKTLAYTDDEIADFIEELEKDGFFKNGIAVITGDHRIMLPIEHEELEKYGEDAVTRVPLIIKGAGIEQGVIDRDTAHDSLRAILGYLELKEYPLCSFQLNPFTDQEKSEDIVYQKMEPADEVMIESGKNIYTYHLEGDESAFTGDTVPGTEKAASLAGLIWYLREGALK